jgi:hypothetical protein
MLAHLQMGRRPPGATRASILGLWRQWDDAEAKRIAAVNLLLDAPAAQRQAEIQRLKEEVGECADAGPVLVEATSPDGAVWLVVGPGMPGVRVGAAAATLGLRGLDACRITFEACRVPSRNRLGDAAARGDRPRAAVLALARLGVAAIGVGLAQAAFEAALRYSQQRTPSGSRSPSTRPSS